MKTCPNCGPLSVYHHQPTVALQDFCEACGRRMAMQCIVNWLCIQKFSHDSGVKICRQRNSSWQQWYWVFCHLHAHPIKWENMRIVASWLCLQEQDRAAAARSGRRRADYKGESLARVCRSSSVGVLCIQRSVPQHRNHWGWYYWSWGWSMRMIL